MKFRGKYQFKQWLDLESLKEKISLAVENKQPEFPDHVFAYLSTAFRIHHKWYEHADWLMIVKAFYVALTKSPIVKLPILTPNNEKFKEEPWSYDGRNWHLYSHMLAKEYGWSLEYISQLQVGEALAKIQEILVDNQLDREFFYGLSEIAYPYNEQSKKSIFKPLDRPHWMREKIQPVQRFKIPKAMMPMGVVNIQDVLPDEYLPKEIIH